MIARKTKLFLAVVALFLATYIIISCNDNSGKNTKAANSSESVDTTKMDTASTRPVKTTNK